MRHKTCAEKNQIINFLFLLQQLYVQRLFIILIILITQYRYIVLYANIKSGIQF